jgi:hypothetical protein
MGWVEGAAVLLGGMLLAPSGDITRTKRRILNDHSFRQVNARSMTQVYELVAKTSMPSKIGFEAGYDSQSQI